ncbi:MmyB family transcriptional regulator [Kitasatospora sp. HPMI-4]|uniref:MmyB family transcriptional regulator n=1 Tax=Kitasatospora sp. HPMI-4 TaxID=3448443 RepID=UPI003F1DCC08
MPSSANPAIAIAGPVAVTTSTPPAPRGPRLIGELSTRSDEFRTLWAAQNVRLHQTGTETFHHPAVGGLADPVVASSSASASPGGSGYGRPLVCPWMKEQGLPAKRPRRRDSCATCRETPGPAARGISRWPAICPPSVMTRSASSAPSPPTATWCRSEPACTVCTFLAGPIGPTLEYRASSRRSPCLSPSFFATLGFDSQHLRSSPPNNRYRTLVHFPRGSPQFTGPGGRPIRLPGPMIRPLPRHATPP